MRRRRLARGVGWGAGCAVLLSLLGAVRAEEGPPIDEGLLTVMTWNIGYARLKNNAAQDRDMSHVASVIAGFKPSVVVLQEQATSGQLKLLLDALNGQYSGKTSASDKGSRGISILSRLPVNRWDTFQTPMGWGGLLITARSGKLKKPFCVMGCYAPCGRRSTMRAQYCRGFVDIARSHNLPTFIAGDFNM
ncbi:MAG: endonuclease/exonuclease/phosphatase family protein, partial [Kiritimatiellae bacterium]|nr:endonuclease/exonuclease/phosphatase family protein [Kiritimatiellia bacterium]